MPRTLLLDASDRVSLTDCAVAGDLLVDRLTGERHAVNHTAVEVLHRFDGRHRLGDLALDQARRHHINRTDADRDLRHFVSVLEAAGLVRVRRRRRSWLHPAGFTAAGVETAATRGTRRRFSPSVRGCVAASVRAGRVLAIAAASASTLGVVAITRFAPSAPLAGAFAPLILVLVILSSVAVHEAGHLLAIRGVGGRPLFVAAATHQVAVVHDVTAPSPLRRVAVSGPAAGTALALVAWPVLANLPPPIDGLTGPAAVLLAGGHLASLLPWFADGRHLWAGER